MATCKSHASLSSDPDLLLDNLPDESDSDAEFKGYLRPDDGPVAYRNGHYPEDYDCYSGILTRSYSLDSLTEIECVCEQLRSTESPLHGVNPSPLQGSPSFSRQNHSLDHSPSLSPMHASRSPLAGVAPHSSTSSLTSQVKINKQCIRKSYHM